jgi:hypothetical protein
MEKWFSGREFVAARDAGRCSGFARTATAGSAIAARLAAPSLGAANAARPIAATSGVWRADSTTATGNVRTGTVPRRLAGRIKVPFRSFLRHHSAVEKRSRCRLRSRCHLGCPVDRKTGPILGCAARSVVGQAASSIRFPRFHDEGELA